MNISKLYLRLYYSGSQMLHNGIDYMYGLTLHIDRSKYVRFKSYIYSEGGN